MSDTVIQVENLSKYYHLGVVGTGTLSHDLSRWWAMFRGKPDPSLRVDQIQKNVSGTPDGNGERDYIWALRDISFEVKQGEVLGIIGRNGAGKSTLLKILSRVTAPTTGECRIKGRIASLLEVGTGFHPELTGRENIFLNGAILGMTKEEIRQKFDEIVAFAEVEKFIDTPVKRYSSGMYVRLAFAVAAHLEPEILIVDEVLAVGDAQFQKKCLGKMQNVSSEGRTVLFVSHNMGAIRQLCQNVLWIDKGLLHMQGKSSEIIDRYLQFGQAEIGKAQIVFPVDNDLTFQFKSIRLLSEMGEVQEKFNCDSEIIIELDCVVSKPVTKFYGYMVISKLDGTTVIENDSFDGGSNPFDSLAVGNHKIRIPIPPRTIAPGSYNIYFNFTDSFSGGNVYSPGQVCSFDVYDLTSRRGNERRGFTSILLPWVLRKST